MCLKDLSGYYVEKQRVEVKRAVWRWCSVLGKGYGGRTPAENREAVSSKCILEVGLMDWVWGKGQ